MNFDEALRQFAKTYEVAIVKLPSGTITGVK
jgi:hypothetical protein